MNSKNTNYKQTEIGEIPEDWNRVKISELCTITRGASPRPIQAFISKKGTPWVKISDATSSDSRYITSTGEFIIEEGESKSRVVYPGDFILSNSATPGLPRILKIRACIHDGWLLLRDFKNIDKNFLYYLLLTQREQLVMQGNGSVFTNLKTDILKNHVVSIPELDEQQQIASILSSLDDKIELNRRMNKTLEEIGKALFKRWFVDFEFPNENGEPYKSSGGEMVDSELGEIPKGWNIKSLDDVSETFGGGTPSTKNENYWKNGSLFWATPSDITSLKSPIIFDTTRKITEAGLSNSSAKLLPPGTVLLTSRATVGLLAISDMQITTNQGFISVVCNKNISNYFMYFELLGRQHEIINKATGSTFREISRSTFRAMDILVPSQELHDKFSAFITSIFSQIRNNSLEIERLSDLRDSLLPRLMSGRIRV